MIFEIEGATSCCYFAGGPYNGLWKYVHDDLVVMWTCFWDHSIYYRRITPNQFQARFP